MLIVLINSELYSFGRVFQGASVRSNQMIVFMNGLTVLEIVKDLSGLIPPLTYGAQLSVNLLTSVFDLHPVLKLPRCPVCGRADKQGAMVRPFLEKA